MIYAVKFRHTSTDIEDMLHVYMSWVVVPASGQNVMFPAKVESRLEEDNYKRWTDIAVWAPKCLNDAGISPTQAQLDLPTYYLTQLCQLADADEVD